MKHRGITLIELLIALAILLAIGAIATPFMLRTLDERRFESAGDQIEQQLLLARAYAQRTGAAVEVRYHPETRRITARRFMSANDANGAMSNNGAPVPGRQGARGEGAFGPFEDADDQDRAIVEAWSDRALPRGIELSDQLPEQLSPTMDLMQREFTANSDLAPPTDEPIRLAVFLPDGAAMLTRTVWLTDDRDRLGRIRISAWTGTAKYERLPDITDEAPHIDDEADDEAAMRRDAFDFE